MDWHLKIFKGINLKAEDLHVNKKKLILPTTIWESSIFKAHFWMKQRQIIINHHFLLVQIFRGPSHEQ